MNRPPTVRRARPDELDQVGQLTLEAYVADGVVGPADPYARQLRDAARRAREAELLVAANPDGQLLGTVTLCVPGARWAEVSRPGELEFRMLAVAPADRNRGIGELLIRAVLHKAAHCGAHRVVLSSSPHMHAAHRLYARLGFTRQPDRDWAPTPDMALWAFALGLAS